MTEQHEQAFQQLFERIFKGNEAAMSLAFTLMQFFHIWDDIKDRDFVKLDTKQVDRNFVAILTSVAANPLWDLHLQGVFLSVYFRWQAANKFESDLLASNNTLAKAWMLRAGCYDLFVMIARKLYGNDWAEEIAPEVYMTYGESFQDFLLEVRHA